MEGMTDEDGFEFIERSELMAMPEATLDSDATVDTAYETKEVNTRSS